MFRTFLSNIAYAFRQDPFKAAASVLGVFQTHPVVVFQIVVFLRFPTLTSAAMVALGGLANHLLVNLHFLSRAARTWLLLHREVVGPFRDFVFHRVTVEQYLDGADYADMDHWLVKKMLGPSATLNDTVRVHVWRKPGAVVANLASYSVPFFGANVFLTDEPATIHGIRRYQVLHEIGHALMRIGTSTSFIELGVVPGLFFLAWFASTAEWTLHAAAGGLAYATVLFIWRTEIRRQRQVGRLMDEIVADGFAVGYLSPQDCRAAASSPLLPYLKDRDLPELYNAIRLTRLREMLELGAAGDADRAFDLSVTDLPDLTLEASLPAILLVGVMGVYATPPTGGTVAWTGALTGGLLIAALFLVLLLTAYRGALLQHLQLRSAPDA